MKHVFIINPAAGKGRSQNELEKDIPKIAEECGISYEIYGSLGIGDAERYVRRLCEESEGEPIRFYACGGDGTLNEIANGTVGFDNAEIGVIPVGTGNDFVKNFDHRDPFFDIAAQINGKAIKIDGVKINDKYSINMANMGFDCSVVETVAKIKRRPWISSEFAYIAGVIAEFVKLPDVKVKSMTVDGERVNKSSLLLCVLANGCFYGGGFHPAPKAELDDGLIDIFYIDRISRLNFINLIGSYKKGTYINNERIMKMAVYRKCREVDIDFGEEVSVCVDGEIAKFNSVHIESAPRLFNFILPEGVSYKDRVAQPMEAIPV
ncbi:MAG: YegS/Rv2252/BmrU family lipid kinase [Ruminococcaceae bacterium]|nr:YegS/Rv2252/BmrU family lipid kinase [Oscillospiraceae bacterium]